MSVKTTRLPELLELGQDEEADMLDWHGGYFDEKMNYHLIDAWPDREIVLFPNDWIHETDIVKHAQRLGLPVPEDPEIEQESIF